MAIWTLTLLLVTVAFLAYKHPLPIMQKYLPQWLWPSGSDDGTSRKGETVDGSSDKKSMTDAAPDVRVATEDTSETETTPKVSASKADDAVPSFSLNGDNQVSKMSSDTQTSAPSFPADNSAQRAAPMPPPSRPTPNGQQKLGSSLMPPPARPTPVSRVAQPSQATSLRVPTTGPLPNRGPPANSQQRVSNSLAPTAAVGTSNSRGKILLKPGHSPMDWAALTRSPSSNLSGVSTFQRVTPSQLRRMTGRKGKPAWSSWQGKVYNITPYVDFHPGGAPEIMKCAGRDGEELFMEVHPWVNWENMLGACLVGVMVPEAYHEAKGKEGENELEGLD